METKDKKGTYNRKYYLHRRIKKAGCSLHLEETHKTIYVPQFLVEELRENKYLCELQNKYRYGVQISNPLWS